MIVILFYLYSIFTKRFEKSSDERSSKYKLKLPKIPHLILYEKDIKNRQIFIIGDVHGCLQELEDLLVLANYESDKILLIFVGDLVNKGPHSVETIRKVREMNAYAVRGNHEEIALVQYMTWRNGEVVTPRKCSWTTELNEDEVDFLQELPYTIEIPSKNALIVHGGIVPGTSLENQNLTHFISMRSLQTIGEKLIASPRTFLGKPWASFWFGPRHVYFGHDAERSLQQYPYATGLDTRCLYGGFISGIFLDSNKILQIRAKLVHQKPKIKTE
ncbi:serine/threonine-protein phosphatase 1-like [Mytilus trossulus]|uniref:serine/threonine-protein phosphatase 1-like n=1 Tax=Mytilus trossulus TaxID=6551 RepID=UPI0030053C01